jgi:hypothetical protein
MAVRVYPVGYEYMDPVSPSPIAGSGLIVDDLPGAPGGPPAAAWQDRPDQQRSDLFLNQSLRRWMNTPREVLAQTRPPLPPVPQPFGYSTMPMTLDDVVAGNFAPARRGRPGENMSGSLRNSTTATNPIG